MKQCLVVLANARMAALTSGSLSSGSGSGNRAATGTVSEPRTELDEDAARRWEQAVEAALLRVLPRQTGILLEYRSACLDGGGTLQQNAFRQLFQAPPFF